MGYRFWMNFFATLGIFLTLFAGTASYPAHSSKASKAPEENTLPNYQASEPTPLPEIAFLDGEGKDRMFDDYYGTVLLVNLWATWCAPCVTEMPDLAALQKEFKRSPFKVIALSEDFKGAEVVKAFYEANDIRNLEVFVDKKQQLFRALNIGGLPVTLLVDAEGHEVGRFFGYTDWRAPEIRDLLNDYIMEAKTLSRPSSSAASQTQPTATPVAEVPAPSDAEKQSVSPMMVPIIKGSQKTPTDIPKQKATDMPKEAMTVLPSKEEPKVKIPAPAIDPLKVRRPVNSTPTP